MQNTGIRKTTTALLIGVTASTYSSYANSMNYVDKPSAKEELNLFKDPKNIASTYSEIIPNSSLYKTRIAQSESKRPMIDDELLFIDDALKIITGLDFISVDPEKEARIDQYFASKKTKTKVLKFNKKN